MKDKNTKQLIKWVQAQLNEWDPIGVADQVDDEYDSYAPQIAGMLLNGDDAHRVSEHLRNIETVAMGLQGNAARAKATAEALVVGFKKRDYAQNDDG